MGFDRGSFEPIAVADRSGRDESQHFGAGVALAADGSRVAAVGDPDLVVYPRSALKPLQATAMIELGLDVPDDLLALVCASHDGAEPHLDGVRRLLARYDLDLAALDNTPARPYGDEARTAARLAGTDPSPLQQNCSGKHAGMLATCVVNGWPTEGYLDPGHPLQRAITTTIERLAGPVHGIGVDGCGAPTHAISLTDLARGFAVIAASGSPVPRAMNGHAEMVGGVARDVTLWMQAVPGLIAKEGAAGVMAVARADGRAAAFKIADGSDLARRAVTTRALELVGVDVGGEHAATAEAVAVPALGHGFPVGTLRPLDWTPWSS